ncbi:MAG: DoxX family protein [Thermoprotei archaeon]
MDTITVSMGILVFRVFYAGLLIPHAIPKFGKNRAQTKQMANQLGLGALIDISGLIEILGGLAILLGFLWIVASWILVIFGIGITIIARTKFKKPFLTSAQSGFDFELFYLAGAVMFVITGPGVFSLDHILSLPSTI